MMKFNSQNSSEDLYNSLNFAPCGPPNDLADRRAASGGFKLESPALAYKEDISSDSRLQNCA